VYRNPESLRDESACTPDVVLRGNFAFDRISLASFDGAKIHEADEIRVGTHFLAVTGRWGNNQEGMLRQITQAGPQGPNQFLSLPPVARQPIVGRTIASVGVLGVVR
jgi:hypothetical protein